MDVQRRSFDLGEIRVSKSKRSIQGYAAVYGPESVDMGGWRETFKKGAFRKSLSRDLKTEPILLVWQHDISRPLASTRNGSLKLEEHDQGLFFRATLNNTSWSDDGLEAIKSGDTAQMSFAFRTLEDEWSKDRTRRTVTRAHLLEVSPVSFPAYPASSVSLRRRNKLSRDKLLAELNGALRRAKESRQRGVTDEFRDAIGKVDDLTRELPGCPLVSDRGLDAVDGWLNEPATEPEKLDPNSDVRRANEKPGPFRSVGEQLQAVARAASPGEQADPRLFEVRAPSGASESFPSEGGFLVQTDFAQQVYKSAFNAAQIADRCRRITVSTNSNTLKINAVDETSRVTGSRWGGVSTAWANEADELTASKPKFRQMEFHLNKLTGLFYGTDELIADASVLGQLFNQAFSEEIAWVLDNSILNGSGVGQPLGVLNSGSLITVDKESGQAQNTVVYENIVNMWSRMLPSARQNAVWLINIDVEPQLHAMSLAVGTAGVPVYMPAGGLSQLGYSSLFGRPVLAAEQCKTLGTVGDIVLFSPQDYAVVDKGGMQFAESMHVRFIYDEMTYRVVYRLDAQPLLNSPITPANGTNTLSGFVALETRS